jgi:TolA-binding protein
MKKRVIFVFFMLTLLSFWQWSFFELKEYFSGSRELQIENNKLKVSVDREKAKTDLASYKFQLFRQNVAKIIPSLQDYKTKNENVRSLASVVQNENPEFLRAAEVENKVTLIKEHFAGRKYKQVVQAVNELIASDPVTPAIVTLYFMLAESYFQLHELSQCVQVSEKMMKLFPENEKTGMVMLRVGILLKEKNRSQEARETWSIVASAYESKELKEQAHKLIAGLERSQ